MTNTLQTIFRQSKKYQNNSKIELSMLPEFEKLGHLQSKF